MNASKNNPKTAKRMLKDRGWSYRAAAPRLGVHYSHLNHVLNGRRESRSLLIRIAELPSRISPKSETLSEQ